MNVIEARNVNDAILQGMDLLLLEGFDRDSRNGQVRVIDGPVTTEYSHPEENVLFWPERDANPFFHLYEAAWMLAGKQDVESLVWFVKGMKEFSDNGIIFNGAYGWRWSEHFKTDQVAKIIHRLREWPDDRRCVLGMWDPLSDLRTDNHSKDVPCNTHAYFNLSSEGALDMTVCNRSNDIIWGTYGANAVHFSVLQKYIAEQLCIPTGVYWQISNNFHAYKNVLEPLAGKTRFFSSYGSACTHEPLLQSGEQWSDWQVDLKQMFSAPPLKVSGLKFRTTFFEKTLRPMIVAYAFHKVGAKTEALGAALEIHAADWRRACTEWLKRRAQ